MEVRLVQLLGSFISATSDYTLARLEYAMRHPRSPAPPVIPRLTDASEASLRREWPAVAEALERAQRFVLAVDDRRGKRAVYDRAFGALQRSTRELEQYARAVRWVLSVDNQR
jgi:hypothetical protein